MGRCIGVPFGSVGHVEVVTPKRFAEGARVDWYKKRLSPSGVALVDTWDVLELMASNTW